MPPRGRLRDVLMDGDAEETEGFLRQVLDTGAPLVRRDQPVRWQHDPARQRAMSLSAFGGPAVEPGCSPCRQGRLNQGPSGVGQVAGVWLALAHAVALAREGRKVSFR